MTRRNANVFNKLNNDDLSCGRSKKFANLARKCKSVKTNSENTISIEKLVKHFNAKFVINECNGSVVADEAEAFVKGKANDLLANDWQTYW